MLNATTSADIARLPKWRVTAVDQRELDRFCDEFLEHARWELDRDEADEAAIGITIVVAEAPHICIMPDVAKDLGSGWVALDEYGEQMICRGRTIAMVIKKLMGEVSDAR